MSEQVVESAGGERSSITLSRFKDSVAWHVKIVFDGANEDEVLDRIASIHERLRSKYAPGSDS